MPQTDNISRSDASHESCATPSGVHATSLGAIRLFTVSGSWRGVQTLVRSQVLGALADQPRGVICDLTDLDEEHLDVDALWQVADLAGEARVWPSTPVVAVCTEAQRELLRRCGIPVQPEPNQGAALRRVASESRAAQVRRTRLEPRAQSCRTAREFLDATWSEWRLSFPVDDAKLVVNELMRRVLAHATAPIRLSVAMDGQTPWLMVREMRAEAHVGAAMPHECTAATDERPTMMADMLCSAWGSLPTSDGSRALWAALAP